LNLKIELLTKNGKPKTKNGYIQLKKYTHF